VTGTGNVCAGNPASFTITPAGLSGYTLLENGITVAGSATGTITVNNLTAGPHTFTAIAYDATGAMASSNTINVTVYPQFAPTINSSGGTAICNGQSLVLSTQTGNNYLWSNGATSSSITVTTAGSYSVTVTNSNGCTGSSTALNITVQSSPAANINAASDTICPGKTTTLTASAGNSWLWSNGATTQSITTGAGSYTVTVTGTGGCSGVSTPQVIANYAVNTPVITPSGTISIIQGDSVQLQAGGGSNYAWNTGATTSAIWVKNSGSYSVLLTTANGCTASSAPVAVTIINKYGYCRRAHQFLRWWKCYAYFCVPQRKPMVF
jgi:hypothetical protein